MIETPTITRSQAQDTALIRLTIPRPEIRKVMGPGLQEIMGALAAQGLSPAGPWLSHHLSFPPGKFDFEICVPVPRPVTAVGRVQPGRLEAMTVARTVLHGGYELLSAAWPELDAWIRAQGRTPKEELWEVYRAGPESGPDPKRWRTELYRPLAE